MTSRFAYTAPEELPAVVPVFPLTGALLLPRGILPLNIFEPRYLDMVDGALKGDRLIGVIQPQAALTDSAIPESPVGRPDLCATGCLGRITGFQETEDERYMISLTGVARFRPVMELEAITAYRQFRIDATPFADDFEPLLGEDEVDRDKLLGAFQAFLDANDMEADWPNVEKTGNETLVNALSMMSPYGPREKQALLEADDLRTRAEILVAITEMTLKSADGPSSDHLQ